jgi:hypothetical protein
MIEYIQNTQNRQKPKMYQKVTNGERVILPSKSEIKNYKKRKGKRVEKLMNSLNASDNQTDEVVAMSILADSINADFYTLEESGAQVIRNSEDTFSVSVDSNDFVDPVLIMPKTTVLGTYNTVSRNSDGSDIETKEITLETYIQPHATSSISGGMLLGIDEVKKSILSISGGKTNIQSATNPSLEDPRNIQPNLKAGEVFSAKTFARNFIVKTTGMESLLFGVDRFFSTSGIDLHNEKLKLQYKLMDQDMSMDLICGNNGIVGFNSFAKQAGESTTNVVNGITFSELNNPNAIHVLADLSFTDFYSVCNKIIRVIKVQNNMQTPYLRLDKIYLSDYEELSVTNNDIPTTSGFAIPMLLSSALLTRLRVLRFLLDTNGLNYVDILPAPFYRRNDQAVYGADANRLYEAVNPFGNQSCFAIMASNRVDSERPFAIYAEPGRTALGNGTYSPMDLSQSVHTGAMMAFSEFKVLYPTKTRYIIANQ